MWGYNALGGLGDNTTTKRSSPVQTVAYGSNWKKIVLGVGHAIAIKSDGTLWCWGANATCGQLGDNTTTARSSPVQTVAFGSNWMDCSANAQRTAATKTDGTLWCWGRNDSGQLGDNTITYRSSPVQTIAFGTNWKQVSCGAYFTAAIKTDGTLWSWGDNLFGQLGDNTRTSRSSPIQTVAFGTNWMQVSCGDYHTVATKKDGTVWCWGYNSYGQMGDNTTTHKSSPVQTVAFGTNWKQVSCGWRTVFGIKTDGTLWGWGDNGNGQLGDNTTTHRSSPVQTVAFGTNWKQVAGGSVYTSAIKTDGTLWNWGINSSGELGDNTTTNKSSPVQTILYGNNWKTLGAFNGSSANAAIKDGDF